MKILDWRQRDQFLEDINAYASQFLNIELLNHLSQKNINGCSPDDMSWFPESDICANFQESLKQYYSHIKCFHAARPLCVSSYYQKGFIGQNKSAIENQFRKIFSDVDIALIGKAIESMNNRGQSEKGRIYFVCDEKDIIEESGHYLIQGSEYIMALATKLTMLNNHRQDYRLRLREEGIPTVFEVDIPLEEIPDYQLAELARAIIALWGNTNLFPEEYHLEEMNFVLFEDVLPSSIVNHWHPSKIRDPHFKCWYYPRITKCEMCGL